MDDLLVQVAALSAAGTALMGFTALVCRFAGSRISRRTAYLLWILVLARLLCPLWSPGFSKAAAEGEAQGLWTLRTGPVSQLAQAIPQEAAQVGEMLLPMLTALWALGAAAVLLVRWASYRALKGRLLAGAVPAGEDTRCLLGHLTRDRRRPAILCAPQVPAPMLMGVVRPVILIPPQAEGQAGLEDMLAHELVHWRRKDLWVKWAAALAAAVHWLNPAAWWLIARLDRACELACDEAVVRAWPPQRRARYGTLILALASGEGWGRPEGLAGFSPRKGQLKERLICIMKEQTHPLSRRLSLVTAVAVVAAALVLGIYAGELPGQLSAQSEPSAPEVTQPVSDTQETHELAWPIAGEELTLSTLFGGRIHPVTGEISWHDGTDIVVQEGTPVLACAAGEVTQTGFDAEKGNYIEISHGSLSTRYCQLEDVAVAAGDQVTAGSEIGTVGSTGASTGAHLHLEVYQDGVLTDPLNFLSWEPLGDNWH